jgi:hypothetical protein
MKHADIHLPYFKQGDDLSHHLEHCATVEDALEAHAQQLEYAADLLRKVRGVIAGQGVKIEADTHMIMASGPDEIIEALIDAKYASKPPWEDEEDFEDKDDDQDDGGVEMKTGWDRVF